MPVLRLSRKVARSLRLTPADLFDTPAERAIAQGRLLLCTLCLWAVYLDPAGPLRQGSSAFELLIAYSAFALALVAFTSVRMVEPLGRLSIHGIDIAALAGSCRWRN